MKKGNHNFGNWKRQGKNGGISLLVAMALAVVLTGCAASPANSGYSKSNKNGTGSGAETTVRSGFVSLPKEQLPDVSSDHACLTDYVKLDEEGLESFLAYWSANPARYSYEYAYELDRRLAEYRQVKVACHHKNKLSEITADALFDVVKENNESYLNDQSVMFHKELDDERIMAICELIEEVVNQYLKEGHGLDEDRIKCTLSDLKIVRDDTSMSFASVSAEGVMVIAPRMIENGFSITGDFSEEEIYVHEIMHVLQKECPCIYEENPDLKKAFGPFRENEDVDVNPLYDSWILEALAEKNACEYLNIGIFTYQNMVWYLDSIAFTQLPREDFQLSDVNDLSFKRELSDLYECLGAETEQEQMEALKMLYNVQIMQDCPKGFEKIYLESKGLEKMTEEEQAKLRYLMKAEACQSYSRFFYKNLANLLEEKGMPLCDVFYLIKIYEMDLNFHVAYDEEDKLSYNQELIKNYLELQNHLFGAIAEKLGVVQEEIVKEYEAYAVNWMDENGEKHQNYDLSWMTEEKREFIQYLIGEHGKYAYKSMREVKE